MLSHFSGCPELLCWRVFLGILYVTEQGASLVKQGDRLLVVKKGKTLHWTHAFNVNQIALMGNISVSPQMIAFLLKEGIDTVFLSYYGKYRGRLVAELGKNVELRRKQFQKIDDRNFRISMAQSYIIGKLNNCRVLLRRRNSDLDSEKVTSALNRIRRLAEQTASADDTEKIMGIEGAGAAAYFGCFGELIKAKNITFDGRNRRPPKDPVNVLLSLGYTLLANAIHSQVNIVGLDPYLGCLHTPEYGRPSLVLDLMEEFRPLLVDSTVIYIINSGILKFNDFYVTAEIEPAAFDFAQSEPLKDEYPIFLRHDGMKKFVTIFEERLNKKTVYPEKAQRLTYRDVILEQVRLFARCLTDDAQYKPFVVR